MLTQQIVFYLLAAVAVFSALMVVVQNNPVRCALFLVLTFLATAGIWILAYAEFLALILVLVYVGAVMTLFLFVIMMLNIDVVSMKRHFVRHLPLALLAVSLLVLLMLLALRPESFAFIDFSQVTAHPQDYSNIERIGMVLYTDYVYPFITAAILLLVAIIAAVTLAHRGPRNRVVQDPVEQMLVEPKQRIRIVKMSSSSKGKK